MENKKCEMMKPEIKAKYYLEEDIITTSEGQDFSGEDHEADIIF